MPTRRQSRVNELIRKELSDLIRREVRDPRLAEVTTITEVNVAGDLRSAKVFVSILGTAEEKAQTLEGLRAAASFIYRGLKERLDLRYIPFLTFHLDESIESGTHLLELMKQEHEKSGESGGG